MASRFWVGGTGTWDSTTTTNWSTTTGGTSGASVPVAADTAIFDTNSGAVTVTTNYAVSITGLTLDTGFNGTVVFGATFTHTFSGTVTLTKGTLNTNGQAVSSAKFASNNSNTRTLTLGATSWTITGNAGIPWDFSTTTNLTFNANTSTITFSAASVFPNMGGKTFNNVVYTGGGQSVIAGAGTYTNLTVTGTVSKTDSFQIGTITVTGTLTMTGNSATSRLFWTSTGATTPGTTQTCTAAAVSLTNVDIQDRTGAGAAAPFTGTSLGDCQGNNSITFDVPATQTHTASAGGNWSDVTKWTTRVPLPQDNVVVNASTTGTLISDMPRMGNNIDFTAFAGTWSTAGGVGNTIFGNLTIGTATTISGNNGSTLQGRGAQTLTTNGRTFTQRLTSDCVTGTYTLQDSLVNSANVSAALTFTSGTFDANGKNVTLTGTTLQTVSATGGTLILGSGTWELQATGALNIWNINGATVSGASATILINSTSASTRTFVGGGFTYGTLTYTIAGSTGTLIITGANTFGTINFSDATNARTLTLPASVTNTVTTLFNVQGTSTKLMTVNSSSSGTQATLASSIPGIVADCDYLSLKDSAVSATNGGEWYAGLNSTISTGVTGWLLGIHSASVLVTPGVQDVSGPKIV